MMKRMNAIHLILAVCFLFILVFQCVPSTVNAAPEEIRIGSSICKTGPMAPFGLYQEWGYTTVVNDVNKAGGVYLSKYGKKLPVKLFLYDDQSTPDKSAQNTERLILKDEVHGLLSPSTPPMVIPAAVIADREGVPMSAALCPIRAFLGARDQWTWVWDMFFDELDMARQQMLTMDTVKSNRKVALC